ncbi:MAG: UDP-glucose/GDP-mannose dehydrogenase family protein [Pseudomonadales bacterium]|jgi:UDPglucose 6-dehydrogenase|nr:UDP-glucose/GDP-mannose dehydrogenase family protein [Pseudomonadales bacterium]
MKISIYGTGYVGLVTGACLADVGHDVLCMDVDEAKIARLERGEMPIYEPGLAEIVEHCSRAGRLRFTTDAARTGAHGVLQFIAVGTPADEDGSADMQYVHAVARQIGRHLARYAVVVTKSTVPVGTAARVRDEVAEALRERGAEIEFDVASNPEFLKEGAAVEDFNKPDRIIVGTDSERVRRLMRDCYAPFARVRDKIMFMDIPSAELTKYAANGMLATKISFMNEIANIAERVGADVEQVRQGIGSDPRIGYHFIYPGCGYGGSCFPKDLRALSGFARAVGYEAPLVRSVEEVNERQKRTLFAKLEQALDGALAGATIALWGLAFKPNTDDMRDAPSRTLMEALWAAGARVRAYDPEARSECTRIYGERPDLVLVDDRASALDGADALVICTEWKEFRAMNTELFLDKLTRPIVVDGRNLYDPQSMREAGIRYLSVGRRSPVS